jgi:hypothetical protein
MSEILVNASAISAGVEVKKYLYRSESLALADRLLAMGFKGFKGFQKAP